MYKFIKIAFCLIGICGMSQILTAPVFAQKVDTGKVTFKPKPKVISRVPAIKGSVQPFKPNTIGINGASSNSNGATHSAAQKNTSNKILTVLKLYPNPVAEQLNVNLKLEREAVLSVKIIDPLGNEILTLLNEKTAAGEQTKTFQIPRKLSRGIYFVRIIAGGDPKVLKISVL
ncbi:MAG: T9SS type A sorting domain-containing protein [Pedobacter sp.]|nr:MAG: T9SS type A sorting domain-containing protein [Pedobacter sp.]